MKQELRPLFDYIVVREVEESHMRKSGLVLPDSRMQRPPQEGIVIAVGPGQDWWQHVGMKMPVGPGDHVVFPYQAGTYVEIDEEKLLVLQVGVLLGVLADLPADAVQPRASDRKVIGGDEPYEIT